MRSGHTRVTVALFGLCIGCVAGCGVSSGESLAAPPAGTNEESSAHAILLSSQTIDFGIVPQGQERRHYVELKNTAGQPIEIERFETGCDCLRMSPAASHLDSGETAMMCLRLDLTAAREFVGTLMTQVAGMDREGKTVFSLSVHVDVRPVSYFRAFEELEEPTTAVPPLPVVMP